ncbi:MAG: cytochrome c oxidase subunit 3 [Planctomycetes bacterium]|nr:cytochrome c oxidase subunit 3 [Planctomycetota bacterium]
MTLSKPMSAIRAPTPSRQALAFFAVAAGCLAVGGGLGAVLATLSPRGATEGSLRLPLAFVASTVLLWTASTVLARALHHVRLERQRPFRQSLIAALAAGTLFVGVQGYGLWCLLENRRAAAEAQVGEHAFTFVLTSLHGLHVTVAILFLSFVCVRACADRYDHEYYWGVTVCSWFWHVPGVVWMAILLVFAIAA